MNRSFCSAKILEVSECLVDNSAIVRMGGPFLQKPLNVSLGKSCRRAPHYLPFCCRRVNLCPSPAIMEARHGKPCILLECLNVAVRLIKP